MNHTLARRNYSFLSLWYEWFSFPERQINETGCRLLNLQEGETILEIGYGTGRALIQFAGSVGEGRKVFGMDISDGMAKVAKSNISRAKLLKRVELIVGDAVRLPYENEFFDAIFISFTLEIFELKEILDVLEECKRVLRVNGRLGLVAMDYKDCIPVKIYNWFHFRLPSLVDCSPIEVRNILNGSGFKSIELTEKDMVGLPVVILTARKHG
jgi:ubiquinone/menaquinone biosynthesis C-methylase UbiE